MDDYQAFVKPKVATEESFKKLQEMVAEVRQLRDDILATEEREKGLNQQLNQLLWVGIPSLFEEMGLKECKTADGTAVKIEDKLHTSITEANSSEATKWLDDNGHGGIIKRNIVVSFTKEQKEEADKLAAELSGRFSSLEQNKKVHPSTLKAFVKEMREKGKLVPVDLFSIREYKEAKIPEDKPKKQSF